jgi:hypothetical protein
MKTDKTIINEIESRLKLKYEQDVKSVIVRCPSDKPNLKRIVENIFEVNRAYTKKFCTELLKELQSRP